jgi:hypothetical protein
MVQLEIGAMVSKTAQPEICAMRDTAVEAVSRI